MSPSSKSVAVFDVEEAVEESHFKRSYLAITRGYFIYVEMLTRLLLHCYLRNPKSQIP